MNDQAKRLALLLKAIEDVEREFADEKEKLKNEYGERLSNLRSDAYLLRDEILTGQKSLPLEPINQALADMGSAIAKDGGISSMTISAGGESVTIDKDTAKAIRAAVKKNKQPEAHA